MSSWEQPYVGRDDVILAETICKLKKDGGDALYKNIMPVIQSSGTGKSRLAHEAAKRFVTLPLNVRSPEAWSGTVIRVSPICYADPR